MLVIAPESSALLSTHRICGEQVVVEPSGAVGLAAVLSQQFKSSPLSASCQRVGVILCGGNVDLDAKGFWDSWLPAK